MLSDITHTHKLRLTVHLTVHPSADLRGHPPLDPAVRNGTMGPEYARPIRIGADCWIGGGATILGGVTVGDGAVIGAGSVLTKDVAPRTVVAGNPARLLKSVDSDQHAPA